jgi:precorrin-6A/cobalt-precorrin-6A reductase
MVSRVLILGGTSEGRQLAERLAPDSSFSALLSFAGRTQNLQRPNVEHRVGGFGGSEGLAAFLRDGRYDALVDATHPFAARMKQHATRAAELTGIPLLRLESPPWAKVAGDNWIEVADMAAAALALGERPRRVFLGIGRLELAAFQAAPQHDYVIRAVDDFRCQLPRARVLAARGPFELAPELALLEREHIEVVVSKNAGIAGTYAKVQAARVLGLPVVMVARPPKPAAATLESCEQALAWLRVLHTASLERGV